VQAAVNEPAQVRESAKGTVPHQDIAGTQFRLQQGDASRLMETQGGRQERLQQAGAGMEEGENASNGKAAAGSLVRRLTESFL
jgi:hypothetical protein